METGEAELRVAIDNPKLVLEDMLHLIQKTDQSRQYYIWQTIFWQIKTWLSDNCVCTSHLGGGILAAKLLIQFIEHRPTLNSIFNLVHSPYSALCNIDFFDYVGYYFQRTRRIVHYLYRNL